MSIRQAIEAGLPTIITDQSRLSQVLDYLLANAVRCSPGGHITVGARRRDQSLTIWVEDAGAGIEVLNQDRIFDEFAQLEDREKLQTGEIRLGLAVSKRLAALLGSDLHTTNHRTVGLPSPLHFRCRHRNHLSLY